MIKWHDLSQTIHEGMSIVRIQPCPIIKTILEAEKDIANVMQVTLTTHTGTHVDAPLHHYRNRGTIDKYPISRFVGRGVVVNIPGKKEFETISENDLIPWEKLIRTGDIVFINTGWGEKFDTEEYHRHPYLCDTAAQWLVQKRISMIGVDTLTPDLPFDLRPKEFKFPVHKIFLNEDILIVENLRLEAVAGHVINVYGAPIKIKDGDGAPARIFAYINEAEGSDF